MTTDSQNRKMCTAHRARTGKPCRAPAVKGRNVCRQHGATAGRPVTTGRYSRALNGMAKRYVQLLKSEEIFDLKPGLALLDTRIDALLQRATSTGDSPDLRKELLNLYEKAQEQIAAGNAVAGGALLRELGKLLKQSVAVDDAMAAAVDLAERRNQRTERAVEVELARESKVTEKHLLILIDLIMLAVQQTIADTDLREKLINKINAQIERHAAPSRQGVQSARGT